MPKYRILVVEDEPLIRQVLSASLSKEFEIVFAERKAAALGIIANNNLDLIFLDLALPDADGFEAMVEIVKAAGPIPVVVGTGDHHAGNAERGMRKYGLDNFLFKPYNAITLPSTLLKAIWRSEYRKSQAISRASTPSQKLNWKYKTLIITSLISALALIITELIKTIIK